MDGYDPSPAQAEEFVHPHSPISPLIPLSVEANLSTCVDYIWICANRIAKSTPEYKLPNLHFLLGQTLAPTLREYLPHQYQMDLLQHYRGPKLDALWLHCTPPSRSERDEFCTVMSSFGTTQNSKTVSFTRCHGIEGGIPSQSLCARRICWPVFLPPS